MRWLIFALIVCPLFVFGACGDDGRNEPSVLEVGWPGVPQVRQGADIGLPFTVEDSEGDDFSLVFSTGHPDLEVAPSA